MNEKQVHKIVVIGLLIIASTITLITSVNASSMTEAEVSYLNATNLHNEIISHYEKRFELFVLYSSQGIVTEYNNTLRDIGTSFSVLEKTHDKLMEEYPGDKKWSDTDRTYKRVEKGVSGCARDKNTR